MLINYCRLNVRRRYCDCTFFNHESKSTCTNVASHVSKVSLADCNLEYDT